MNMAVRKKRAKKAAKKSVKKTAKKSTVKHKKTSVKRKTSVKKKTSKTVRRVSKTASKRAAKFKLPLLSTLVKEPKKVLQSCRDRCEVAIEMKDAPGLFTQSGMRLPIGPVFRKQPKARKSRSKKSKGAQTLPAEIAHIFSNPSVSL
jgi:uncharacterized Rmd1/YagE family protein